MSGSRGGGCAFGSRGVSASGSGGCAYPPGYTRHTHTWTPPGDTHPPRSLRPPRSTSGQYASYWNAFLFKINLFIPCSLVMYVERDTRKQSSGKQAETQHMEYLSRCLELLISTLIDMVPNISSRSLSRLLNRVFLISILIDMVPNISSRSHYRSPSRVFPISTLIDMVPSISSRFFSRSLNSFSYPYL